MSRTPKRPTAPVSSWRAQVMRATFFPAPGTPLTADSWWNDAVGGEPESRLVRPAARQRQEEGPFEDGGRLVLSINPLGIVQWTLTAEPPKDVPENIPTVGAVEEIAKPYRPSKSVVPIANMDECISARVRNHGAPARRRAARRIRDSGALFARRDD